MALDHSLSQKDLAMKKVLTVNGNEQHQLKNLEKVEGLPHMDTNVDAPASASAHLANVENKLSPIEKLTNDSLLNQIVSPTSKRNLKSKHHHHHRHCGKKHHHHHNCRHRAKSSDKIRNNQYPKILSPSKFRKTNPKSVEQVPATTPSATVPYEKEKKTALVDDHHTPLLIYRDTNVQQSTVSMNQDDQENTGERNIPLHSIENKIKSQRETAKGETQVGNYAPLLCTQSTPSVINNDCLQQIERIYYEDDCCLPSSTGNCSSDSYILQQSDPLCLPQQQSICCSNPGQQQLVCSTDSIPQQYLCSSSSSSNFIQQPQQQYLCSSSSSNFIQQPQQQYLCSPSSNNIIQQASFPQQQQQQYICVQSPAAIQPTIINQIPANTASQSFICMPQSSVQQTGSFVIQQQPQIQSQPLQMMQNPQAQSAQYLQITSATPQFIQVVQGPSSPQLLYQRPYDPVMLPGQNQQLAVSNSPVMIMSQPSYAPARAIGGAQSGQSLQGANMFRQALVRTVANRAGLPFMPQAGGGGGFQFAQSPIIGSFGRPQLASTTRALFNDNLQRSAVLPIVPLTPGGLLIPYQPSEQPLGMMDGGFSSTLRNFNNTRQQIQQRTQFLANLQQPTYGGTSSLPVFSANARPLSSRISSNAQPAASNFFANESSSLAPLSRPLPSVIRPQTPYANGNIFGSSNTSSGSSSSSSRSSVSRNRTPYAGPTYAQPSLSGSPGGSILSGPSTRYHSLRP